MSLNLYKRIASVEIGLPGQKGRRISDLRISFSVKKPNPGLKDSINMANIDIYNLSEETRNQINNLDNIVILKVGYEEANGEEILFIGNIKNIINLKTVPNVVTSITAGDGYNALQNIAVALSYKEGTKISQILSDVVKKFGITKKQLFSVAQITDKEFTQGFSFAGQVKTILNKLGEYGNFDWSMQNNALKFVSRDTADDTRAVKITPSTGLLESPIRINDTLNKTDEANSIKGWQIKSLLQAKLEPGGVVVLESQEIPADSKFKIIDVTHTGDTHGTSWFSDIKVCDYE